MKFGLLPAIATAAVLLQPTVSNAQSVEDRIRALEREIQELKKEQAEEKRARQAEQKKQEEDNQVVSRKNPNVKVSVSGQVDRGVLYMDDGVDSDIAHVDNDMSSSRVRFEAAGQITDDLSDGTNFEVEFESNPSSGVSLQDDGADTGTPTFKQRKIELFFKSKTFGAIYLGQGPTASDGVIFSDLSGTGLASSADRDSTGGGLMFRNSATGMLTGITLKSTMFELNGLGRDDRILYDSPRVNGFGLSASHGQEGTWDIAGRYGNTLGDFKIEAAAAYGNAAANSSGSAGINGDIWGWSAAVLHVPTGLNVAVAGGSLERDMMGATDPSFIFAKVGYIADFFPIGTTNFSVDWSKHDDFAMTGDEATVYSIGAVQNIKKVGTEIFVNLRWNDLDRPTVPTDTQFTTIGGARVKF
jgi:hypothetical protein